MHDAWPSLDESGRKETFSSRHDGDDGSGGIIRQQNTRHESGAARDLMTDAIKRGPLGRVLEVPRPLRAFARAWESSLLFLGAGAGAPAGVVVACMSFAVSELHAVFFGLQPFQRLSAIEKLAPATAIAVPALGGLVFGVALLVVARRRPIREVDAIEANALHGGRMSLTGSINVALQTVWSGVGASVGLEAGYTQLGSGIASWIGQAFRLRRRDLRTLVGCGSAGAIAGAFGAPIAGAFYAFELIIGSYSAASLAPVGLAALVGYLVANFFEPTSLGIGTLYVSQVTARDLAIAAAVGLAGAAAGIAIMRGVALCETLLNRLALPAFMRGALGGLIVGLLALESPQVLSSGHGAIQIAPMLNRPLRDIALVFLLKALASVVSLGAGFRGRLFFASLLLGALGGHILADALVALSPELSLDPHVYSIIGMGALSVAVIGGPLTMTFIALETTGDFWLTTAVLIAVIVSAQVTREAFGYSFATWRFHLRGENIRSAADVGWLRDLTVRRMMRADVKSVPAHTTVSLSHGLSARVGEPCSGGERGKGLRRHRKCGRSPRRGARGIGIHSRHCAPSRHHAAADHDREGGGRGLRKCGSGSTRGDPVARKTPYHRSADRILCAAPIFRRTRAEETRADRRLRRSLVR
jgi:CIC family chloride channel protein